MSSSYETLYGVQLLDDLHNYFPAVLYEGSQFHSVRDLLVYIQSQTRSRFDLYTYGRSHHTRERRSTSPPLHPVNPRAHVHPAPFATPSPPLTAASPIRVPAIFEESVEDDLPSAETLLNSILHHLRPSTSPRTTHVPVYYSMNLGLGQQNLEPVVVRPTRQQIQSATTVLQLTTIEPCSICQDSIQIGQNARKLNHCSHVFHEGCIDTWFGRNVHCPICRHDIREVTGATEVERSEVESSTEDVD